MEINIVSYSVFNSFPVDVTSTMNEWMDEWRGVEGECQLNQAAAAAAAECRRRERVCCKEGQYPISLFVFLRPREERDESRWHCVKAFFTHSHNVHKGSKETSYSSSSFCSHNSSSSSQCVNGPKQKLDIERERAMQMPLLRVRSYSPQLLLYTEARIL